MAVPLPRNSPVPMAPPIAIMESCPVDNPRWSPFSRSIMSSKRGPELFMEYGLDPALMECVSCRRSWPTTIIPDLTKYTQLVFARTSLSAFTLGRRGVWMGRAAAPRKPAPNAFWEIAPDLSRRLFTPRADHARLGHWAGIPAQTVVGLKSRSGR